MARANAYEPIQLPRLPEFWRYTQEAYQVERVLMRIEDALEGAPGMASLTKFLLRPFTADSKETAPTVRRMYEATTPDLPLECAALHVFDALLGHMTRDEKMTNVAHLVDMFRCLLARHRRRSCCCDQARSVSVSFVPLCVGLFRQGGHTSREMVQLVECVLSMIPARFDSLLKWIWPWMNPIDVDYLLACFSDQRFHAHHIRMSYMLMDKLMTDKTALFSSILIRQGFKYSFHQEYIKNCGYKLLYARIIREGRPLLSLFRQHFNFGNLRMQMVVEILVHVLYEKGENQRLLYSLWQSRPDPFVTPDEIHHHMGPFYQKPALVEACAQYRTMIPEVPEVMEPRSLKHLARVQIRKSMVQAHTIGEKAVRSLGLPRTIEDYLWNLR